MPVKYVLAERHNPRDLSAPRRFYAVAKSIGEVTLKQMSKDIATRSTVNSSDTLAVLDALNQQMVKELEAGHLVRMGDFGSFQLTLSSESSETAEMFTGELIKKSRIFFRPGPDLKEMLATVTYTKA